MKGLFSRIFNYAMLLLLVFASKGNAEGVRLPGHLLNEAVSKSVAIKSLDASTIVPLTFVLPLRNKEALEDLLKRIQDPSDQLFGKYLTTEEFIRRFAPTEEDYEKAIAYANKLGFTVTGKHPNRTLLNVEASTKSIEKGFNLSLYQYRSPDGRKFYAPNNNPEVPVSIASTIQGVVGLDNYAVWRSYKRKKEDAKVSKDSPSGPGGGFAPSDLVTAYDLSAVPTLGSDQSIALFELAEYLLSDITHYTNYFGLPSPRLTNVLVNGGSSAGIDAEVTLDIQLALALAPESQIYVYEGPNTDQGVLNTYNKIATDNLAKQVSTSWGLAENFVTQQFLQAEYAIFSQMAANGQTIYAAAGDSGAYDDYPSNGSRALAVDDPASQPYIIGVGGTRLNVNSATGAYESESVWNDGLGNGAGGGGVSGVWPIPSWQANVPQVYSKVYRNVPDVCLNADTDTGYAIYHNGQWAIYGGTSCAAPLWAAFTARVNQARLAAQLPTLGFANPVLYNIGTGSDYSSNFHDITNGNNYYYNAGTSYDNATGLGSFKGANLFASLTSGVQPPPPPETVPVINIAMHTNTAYFYRNGIGTYTVNVSNQGNAPTNGPVTVAFTLPTGLTFHSLIGSGWSFNRSKLTCTRTTALKPGASYSPIILNVNVARRAPNPVTTSATVSGGGSVSSTVSKTTNVR